MVCINLAKLNTSITANERRFFALAVTAVPPEGVRVSGALRRMMYGCADD